jgi:hypothetical protein
MLKDTRDGDQAYWCHTCERGWRAGHLPPEARVARKVLSDEQEARVARKVLSDEQEARVAKAKALLEESLEVIPEAVILKIPVTAPTKKTRASKGTAVLEPVVTAPKPIASKPVHLEPEVHGKTKTARVPKIKPIPEPVILELIAPKVRTPRVPKSVLLEPVAQIPEPAPKVSRRQPKVAVPIPQPVLVQKAVILEPISGPRIKKLKPEATPILKSVTVLPKPTTSKQTQRLRQASTAQLDLFA